MLDQIAREQVSPEQVVTHIDITPTWGEVGNMYTRLAESGERKAAKVMRKDVATAMAAAQALHELIPLLSTEQLLQVFVVKERELKKMGY